MGSAPFLEVGVWWRFGWFFSAWQFVVLPFSKVVRNLQRFGDLKGGTWLESPWWEFLRWYSCIAGCGKHGSRVGNLWRLLGGPGREGGV